MTKKLNEHKVDMKLNKCRDCKHFNIKMDGMGVYECSEGDPEVVSPDFLHSAPCFEPKVKPDYPPYPEGLTQLTSYKKAKGTKFDNGKLRWSLLPIEPIEDIIRVLEHGAKKYDDDNWKLVNDSLDRYYNACMRHLTAWKKGEAVDQETGISHLAHAGCCLLFLAWHDNK